MDQVRAVPHSSADHYQTFVRSCYGDVPSELFRRLYLVNAFVKEVYDQDVSRVLHDSLLRELDDVVDAVLGASFPSSMLVDCLCEEPCDWQHGFGQRRSFDSLQMTRPRKKRQKMEFEVKDRTEEFQDWFLLHSLCRLEHREPSRTSGDPEERKWANWIMTVRYASGSRAVNMVRSILLISIQVDWILQSCGCVRKGVKRFFPEDPSCPALVEDLTRKSEIRRRKTRRIDDDLLTTPTHDSSGCRLSFPPADPPGKFDLSMPYDDLPLQYQKMYDSIRPFVKGADDPSKCQGYENGIRQCSYPPVPGSKFCAKCDGPLGVELAAKRSADHHRRIMVELQICLRRTWRTLTGGLSSTSGPCSTTERNTR